MTRLLGEFEVTLDLKGRFMLPAGLKKQLTEADGSRFVLSRGSDKCLTLYTERQWEKVEAVVSRLNEFNEKARKFKRLFLNGATFLEPDAAGRVLLPKSMLVHAGITKDIVLSAQMNKMELWDAAAWKDETSADADTLNSLGGEVLGADFMNPFEGL